MDKRKYVESLIDWEIRINRTFKRTPFIRVRNNVDSSPPPLNFIPINDYVSTVVEMNEKPVIGCECFPDCSISRTCCPYLADPTMKTSSYKDGIINLRPGNAIYECNIRCKCNMECPNRVVQKGPTTKLEIFRTSDGRGWGIKTLDDIKRGQFVMEYLGEVITNTEADRREELYDFEKCTYLFDLDFDSTGGSTYVIDATRCGNAARFINHSCSPNLEVYAVYINVVDGRLPRLALFASRDIDEDEELSFDYKMNKDRNKSRGRSRAEGTAKMLCLCGAKNCRKYLN